MSIGVYEGRARNEADDALRQLAAAEHVANSQNRGAADPVVAFHLGAAQVHATLAVAFATLATSPLTETV